MAADPNAVEQAVSRTLRDNLEKIQRTAEELNQAVHDLVSACASSRPSNALPSMLRAQTTAASLAATFDVLSRFVTGSLQPATRPAFDPEPLRIPPIHMTAPVALPEVPAATPPPVAPVAVAPVEQQEPLPAHPMMEDVRERAWMAPANVKAVEEPPAVSDIPVVASSPARHEIEPPFEMPPTAEFDSPVAMTHTVEPVFVSEPVPVFVHEPVTAYEPRGISETLREVAEEKSAPAEAERIFRLDALPPEEQELHRRAFRVAKVSMQDIKMLRPEDVRVGRENKDLCFRLKDDIEKAHKEYDRRFHSIQSHPVDYFYDWMVEILGGGDPQALGEYPYPSPVMHR